MPSPRPPSGLSLRQERFCHAYLRTGVAASAAVEAGYAVLSCVNQGYRLLQRADIQSRIAGIQAEQARAACDGMDVLLGKLETIYRQAVADRHYTAAARAVDLQARLLRQDRLDRLRLAEIEEAMSDGSGGAGEVVGRIVESSVGVAPTSPRPSPPIGGHRGGPPTFLVRGGAPRPRGAEREKRNAQHHPLRPLGGEREGPAQREGEVGHPAGSDDLGSPPDGEGSANGSDDLGSFPDHVEAAMLSDDPGSSSNREDETGGSDEFSPPSNADGADRIGEDGAPGVGRTRPPRRPPEGGRTGAAVRHTRIGIRASSAREIRGVDGPRDGPASG